MAMGLLGISYEIWLAVAALAALFYLSIHIRKFLRYLKENGARGFGISIFVLGGMIYTIVELYKRDLITYAVFGDPRVYDLSVWLLIGGPVFVLADWILEKLKKKELTSLEEERRGYITRVRKGLLVDKAEEVALKYAKNKVKRGDLQIVSSQKEFKSWIIYLKDGLSRKYKVVLDIEGEVQDWEVVGELPSYLGGTH